MTKRKYDYEIIIKLYQEGKTAFEIADIINNVISVRQIGHIVRDAGISRPRNTRIHILEAKAKKCKPFNKNFLSFFDGLIISDGCLTKPTLAKTSKYQQSCIHKEWLEKIKNVFLKNGIDSSISEDFRKNRKPCWNLQTHSYDQFYYQYHRWYNEEKEVPKDIIFNKQFIKNWVYGDGTLVKTNLRLCCDSFLEKDVDWIIDKFDQIGFKFNKVFMGFTKNNIKKWRVSLCKKNGLKDFYKYIGKCDIDCYSYKWYKMKN